MSEKAAARADDEISDLPEVPTADDQDDEDEGQEQEEESESDESSSGRLRDRLAGLPGIGLVVQKLPTPVLAGIGAALLVLLLSVGASGLLRGSAATSTPDAPAHATDEVTPALDGAAHDPVPTLPPTPSGPLPTATPVRWERQGTGWIGYGVGSAIHRDPLLFPDARDIFTVTTRFAILTASGQSAPYFGIVIAYKDEANHAMVESYTAADKQILVRIATVKGGVPAWSAAHPVAGLAFWGREAHEMKVEVGERLIRAYVDDLALPPWTNEHIAPGGAKGLWVAHQNRIRFDAFEIG